jgi:ABC-type Fe3+-hydroxamate transport system substrate-binding protein
LLYDLGLGERIVGQTVFCIHPKNKFKNATKIGGTKKLHLEKIAALKPDLIIANKEENTKEQVEWLAQRFPVWISNIYTLDDAFSMIKDIGKLTDTFEKANEIAEKIKTAFDELAFVNNPVNTLYLIWHNPWMAAGRKTFINEMMRCCHFKNVLSSGSRYPEISTDEIACLATELILFSSEPFPFKEKHMEILKSALPHSKCMLVDGEMFSWYGSRLLKAADYFKNLTLKFNNIE